MTTKFKPGDRVRALHSRASTLYHDGLVEGKTYIVDRLDLRGYPILDNERPEQMFGWLPETDEGAILELVTDEPTIKAAPHDYQPYDRIRINAELTISHVDANVVRVMHPEWQEGVNLRHSDLAALKPERLPPALKVGDRVRTLGGDKATIVAVVKAWAWLDLGEGFPPTTQRLDRLERVAD